MAPYNRATSSAWAGGRHGMVEAMARRPVPAAPWSFPRRLDVIPGTLSMTVFDHEIQTLGRTIPCWTFVSDGLLGYGQKELVLTVARSPGEHPQAIAEEISTLLASLQPLAAASRTSFRNRSPVWTCRFPR